MSVSAIVTSFGVSERTGEVSARVLPGDVVSDALLVLAHGAGAGMQHPFMEELCSRLAAHRIASFRYQFPYMERGKRRPDPPAVLIATVSAAVRAAAERLPGLPLFAGGKSMGGRMTSRAAAEKGLPEVRGIVFAGFPLHAAGRPGTERGDHLANVGAPMLFLQGTRDKLADLSLLEPICAELGERARLHVVEGADHSFHVLKRSGRDNGGVLDELAAVIASWVGTVLSS